MNRNIAAILKLIRSGLLSEQCELDGDLDWNYIYQACYRQRISSIVYQAIKDNGITVPAEYLRLFQIRTLKDVKTDRDQSRLLDQVFRSFEENQISYIPLKGSFIKYLYPKTEFRQMGDADIYVDYSKCDQIKIVMEQLGFVADIGTKHHVHDVWDKKDELEIELHKAFIGSIYGMNEFFEARANEAFNANRSGARADLDINDHLIYSVAHLAKHCILGSISIRNLTDIYILKDRQGIDPDYLECSLDKINLLNFYKVVCKALDEWFSGSAFSEDSEKLFNRILAVSKEATETQAYSVSVFKDNAGRQNTSFWQKIKYFFRVVFPPFKKMAKHYPVLNKAPVLLPLLYLWRPFHKLFTSPKSVKRFMKVSVKDTDKSIDKYKNDLKMLGLEKMVSDYERKNKRA